MPSDHKIETTLRDAVKAYYADPSDDPPTVNSIRSIAICSLSLDEDFFNRSPWKVRSKEIIKGQFDISSTHAEEEKQWRQSLKRSKSASPRPRKKNRIEQLQKDEEESTELSTPPDSDEEMSDVVDEKPKKSVKKSKGKPVKAPSKMPPAKSKKQPVKPDLSDDAHDSDEKKAEPQKPDEEDDGNSSELSSVIDEPNPPKRKFKAKNDGAKASSKSTSKPAAESDPNAEEIKRLQGWLAKCGIRKVWGKELKPFETSKAKINHLKQLLADVGLTGRYSNEKAAQIKEARELAADIEAVQEGNERWGKNDDEEDAESGRPKRRLVRGAQNYDFLSSDGEETD